MFILTFFFLCSQLQVVKMRALPHLPVAYIVAIESVKCHSLFNLKQANKYYCVVLRYTLLCTSSPMFIVNVQGFIMLIYADELPVFH
jgi:hypothetical protein